MAKVVMEYGDPALRGWVEGAPDWLLAAAGSEVCVRPRQFEARRSSGLAVLSVVARRRRAVREAPGWAVVRRRSTRSGDRFSNGACAVTVSPGAGETLELPAAALPRDSSWVLPMLDIALAHNLALQGGCLLHASAFSISGHGVLAIGRSHSGKSSLAAAALLGGPSLLADDTVIASLDRDGKIGLWPYRRDLYLRGPSERLLPPKLAARLSLVRRGGEERYHLARDASPDLFVDRLDPAAVWEISVDRRLLQSRISGFDQGRLLAGLIAAASPLFLSPRYPTERRALMPVLAGLTAACRGFRVRLGRDLMVEPLGTLERLMALSRS